MMKNARWWGKSVALEMIFISAILVSAILVSTIACRTTPTDAPDTSAVVEPGSVEEGIESPEFDGPSRIILFIGDGMGLSAVAGASYASGRPLEMLGMPEFGLMTTHSHEFVTTDSAASATAIATGEKAHFQGVSVEPGTSREEEMDRDRHLRTLVEAAGARGWKTGILSTVRVNHATPGPFAAHRHGRHQYEDIALDMSLSDVDILLGPGSDFFRDRQDGRNLLLEMEERGYLVAGNASEIRAASASAVNLRGLLAARDMPWADSGEREIELSELVDISLSTLDRDDPEGFFLMVEGSMIDWAGHAFDGERVLSETLDMDHAIGRALEYARGRSDTLVVVTSDHETGGLDIIDPARAADYLSVIGDQRDARRVTTPDGINEDHLTNLRGPFAHLDLGEPQIFGPDEADDRRLTASFGYASVASRRFWDGRGRFSGMHTPLMVPIFAEGPGARGVATQRDNADLGAHLMALIDGQEPSLSGGTQSAAGDSMPKNVILLIGNGLGVASWTAAYYHFGHLATLEMPRRAAVSTHGVDGLVNAPGAAATALATGARTRLGAVGMAPDREGQLVSRASVVELAAGAGKRAGLITTASLMNPTAAAFYAHLDEDTLRREEGDQLLNSGVDFLVGAGATLLEESRAAAFREQGYIVHREWSEAEVGASQLFVLGEDDLGDAVTRSKLDGLPTLAQMTEQGIRHLGTEEGFFLLVHGGQIEARMEDLSRGEALLAEINEFDQAVEAALDFARQDGETLVIVTAAQDHTLSVIDNHYGFHRGFCKAVSDCGGEFVLDWLPVHSRLIRHGAGLRDRELQGEFPVPKIALQYTWMVQQAAAQNGAERGTPSANFVPLFAAGPGEDVFGGFLDQPQIGQWLTRWAQGSSTSMNLDGGGRTSPE